ncbi:MAG: D-2-hydroxyacid dehydrogenase family protein [Betaproteobacteria bacterium]|nr:D-2-hydroxyacid dehydrogenase family protein [Betaproteobacteria bacterium]MDH3438616.1 D-2-hydroxyacid dehydrogenase family protein [Betaproteobacteria bacterium]
MIIAIPDDYHGVVAQLACFSRLSGHDVRVFCDAAPPTGKLVQHLRDADVIVPIRERTLFTRELIASLPKLRLISQTGRSTRHIDIAACTERGIAVTAGTHASPYTVAEHTWALILSALRHIPEDAALMKRGEWRASFSTGLRGKTLGVFGLGMIGKLIAMPAGAFGMQVLVHGRESSLVAARAAGYEIADSKADFFARSDVLCAMVRLSPVTRGIVTAEDLAQMKPTALFVNTARAELVAPGALVNALSKGRPGFAVTDVYENEPVLRGDHPLLKLDNALCTPHTAWLERETYELYFGEAFDNLLAFLAGKPVNMVNPEVLARHKA